MRYLISPKDHYLLLHRARTCQRQSILYSSSQIITLQRCKTNEVSSFAPRKSRSAPQSINFQRHGAFGSKTSSKTYRVDHRRLQRNAADFKGDIPPHLLSFLWIKVYIKVDRKRRHIILDDAPVTR